MGRSDAIDAHELVAIQVIASVGGDLRRAEVGGGAGALLIPVDGGQKACRRGGNAAVAILVIFEGLAIIDSAAAIIEFAVGGELDIVVDPAAHGGIGGLIGPQLRDEGIGVVGQIAAFGILLAQVVVMAAIVLAVARWTAIAAQAVGGSVVVIGIIALHHRPATEAATLILVGAATVEHHFTGNIGGRIGTMTGVMRAGVIPVVVTGIQVLRFQQQGAARAAALVALLVFQRAGGVVVSVALWRIGAIGGGIVLHGEVACRTQDIDLTKAAKLGMVEIQEVVISRGNPVIADAVGDATIGGTAGAYFREPVVVGSGSQGKPGTAAIGAARRDLCDHLLAPRLIVRVIVRTAITAAVGGTIERVVAIIAVTGGGAMRVVEGFSVANGCPHASRQIVIAVEVLPVGGHVVMQIRI